MSIKKKLIRAILITSGTVLLLTCLTYFTYEVLTFRRTALRQLAVITRIVSANSSAALAFDSPEDAYEILSSLKAQPYIVAAGIYDGEGKLFTYYPDTLQESTFPTYPESESYRFDQSYLIGFQPIKQGESTLGTLYIRSNQLAMYERFKLYGLIASLVLLISVLTAYWISTRMQRSITGPIFNLTETAKAISERQDYDVRAEKQSDDEIGLLTEAFNQMLTEIQLKNLEIKSFNQNLELKIAERTSELEAANNELESFSYSVSHDLRAPLRSIVGYSRNLLRKYGDQLDDRGKRYLDIVMDSAINMGQLIDDLLAFSRVGKQNLEKIPLNMARLTSGVVNECLGEQHNKAEVIIKDLPTIEADSSMMKQVMTNLVSNALKYSMKKDKPVIEIGAYQDNDETVYYVKDNGAGFDMLYYDKLFGVFQRLHSNNEFEGIGVGLALVHRIITKHSGKVWAEGKVDEGATFYFSLPPEGVTEPK